ncbi:universal stress protein [Nocardia blacklockiae]|uniref:universal stress protein n=1 Tax=Nocardia blacklockiae TaxID=480036 RepID=UPI0018949058|nr:universal stress protein [Nocardia blacklockiae]MBF6176612.1 universal stress protein [Nocardia blacklockiae]
MTQWHNDIHHSAAAAVVVGVDGSPGATTALDWAADLADRRGRELRVVHGADAAGLRLLHQRYGKRMPELGGHLRAQDARTADEAVRRVRARHPRLRVSVGVSDENPAGLLIRHSATAYRLVIGPSGTSAVPGHLGSILLTIAAHAEGAVAVVRTDPDSGHRVREDGPVVVGIDGSPVSEEALAAAFEEAAERKAELVAVHAWSDLDLGWMAGQFQLLVPVNDIGETEREILAERLAGWQEQYPDVPVARRKYLADPVAALREWSKSAQLLVVGSHGRGGYLGMLLGSTSNALVQHAQCPVLVVHPERR